MVRVLEFTVNGTAIPLARPRVLKCGRSYLPKRSADYRKLIQYSARDAINRCDKHWSLMNGAVEINITEVRKIPKSWTLKKHNAARSGVKKPTSRPDLDNIVKAVLDALNGFVWTDDAQITSIHAQKIYGSEPCVKITVTEFESQDDSGPSRDTREKPKISPN